jgi:hypothetical protein
MAYDIGWPEGGSIVATENNPNEERVMPDRWTLIRDILVLQIKLVFDGIRDFVLVPISFFVGMLSLIKGGPEAGSEFYQLLRMGRRSERWINLFGAAERVYGPSIANDRFPAEDIDEIVSRVESYVVDEYRQGGLTKQAKDQLDRALDSLHKKASRRKGADI